MKKTESNKAESVMPNPPDIGHTQVLWYWVQLHAFVEHRATELGKGELHTSRRRS